MVDALEGQTPLPCPLVVLGREGNAVPRAWKLLSFPACPPSQLRRAQGPDSFHVEGIPAL